MSGGWFVCLLACSLKAATPLDKVGQKRSHCPCEEWEFTVPAHEPLKLPRNNAENAGNVLTCCIVQFYLQCMYESRDLHTEAHAFCLYTSIHTIYRINWFCKKIIFFRPRNFYGNWQTTAFCRSQGLSFHVPGWFPVIWMGAKWNWFGKLWFYDRSVHVK